jgi:DNA polymerase-4
MWGVGKATQKTLARLNIRTFKDLSRMPVKVLEQRLGKNGVRIHRLSMGVDDRGVVTDHDAKSIGHERTFFHDILDDDSAKKELLSLADKVAHRLRRHGVTGRTVTLKVKYGDFVQITRAAALPEPTDDGLDIYSTAIGLLAKTKVGKRPVRLLGISLSHLDARDPEDQLSLFRQGAPSQKRKDLNTALDYLYERHGEKSIRPGTLISPE